MANDDGQPAEGWLTLHQCARQFAADEGMNHRKWMAATVYDLAERYGIPLAIKGKFINMPADEAYSEAGGKLHELIISELSAITLHADELQIIVNTLKKHGRLPTWGDVFDAGKLWCPLYGAIPRPANSPPNSTTGRLAEIIEKARELLPRDLDFEPVADIEEPAFDAPGWCPNDINGEPLDCHTIAARRLVGPGWMHVLQNAQHYGGAQWVEGDDGSVYSHNLDQLPNNWSLLHFARSAMRFSAGKEDNKLDKNINDVEVLAILAISQAFHALRDLLEDGENEWITEKVITAAGLLANAETTAGAAERAEIEEQAAIEIDEARAERDALAPDAERGQRVRGAASGGGRARSERFDDEREQWRTLAAEILRNRQHRQPALLELARLVAARLHPDLSDAERERLARSRRRWLDGPP